MTFWFRWVLGEKVTLLPWTVVSDQIINDEFLISFGCRWTEEVTIFFESLLPPSFF
ncbi:MAG: hypothetical protein OXE77_09855 [Flavobacteriaceae bacterium]|nr:hypothetical protein [Flavobacteriaceae bacterium]